MKSREKEQRDFKNYLYSFLNNPYRWGGDDPINGFDCSGAVQEWLAYFGEDPKGDQTAHALWNYFKFIGRSTKDKRALGGLAFYGSEKKIIHVAMLIDEKRVIEYGGGGPGTTSTENAASQNAFCRIRPIEYRPDFFGVYHPHFLLW